jgi:hypothetical protein
LCVSKTLGFGTGQAAVSRATKSFIYKYNTVNEFHSFRRFRVTHLRKQRTPEDLLRFWIGHGDETVTDRYAKLSEDMAFRKAQADRVGIGFSLSFVPRHNEVVPCCPPDRSRGDNLQVVVM